MKYTISLTDTLTGTTAEYVDVHSKDDESLLFMWFEGNYSCDCNRSLFVYNFDESKELGCNEEDPPNSGRLDQA